MNAYELAKKKKAEREEKERKEKEAKDEELRLLKKERHKYISWIGDALSSFLCDTSFQIYRLENVWSLQRHGKTLVSCALKRSYVSQEGEYLSSNNNYHILVANGPQSPADSRAEFVCVVSSQEELNEIISDFMSEKI